jgi:TPR repeat protein
MGTAERDGRTVKTGTYRGLAIAKWGSAGMQNIKLLLCCLMMAAAAAQAQSAGKTIRICDASGCSDRPRDSATFDPIASSDPAADQRIAALIAVAEKDPRAAHDLGLRYFRGDGVPQNSYQAIQWMRSAGERGDLRAQSALGRLYLTGMQEMGADPAEAERWLTIAAGRGDEEANQLLAEASAAKKDEQALYRWREAHRKTWYGYWYSGYPYYWGWGPNGWYYRYR